MTREEEGGVAVENANEDLGAVKPDTSEAKAPDNTPSADNNYDMSAEESAAYNKEKANEVQNPQGQTLLHLTSDPETVGNLLNSGADVHALDKHGRTPLFYAKNSESAQMLIDAGADVNVKDRNGWTPLHYSMANGEHYPDPDVTKTLIGQGADVNARDDYGLTPLHVVCGMSISTKKVEKEMNGIIEEETRDGASEEAIEALKQERGHKIAAEGDRGELVEALINAGADIGARDRSGFTPMDSLTMNNPNPNKAILGSLLRESESEKPGPKKSEFQEARDRERQDMELDPRTTAIIDAVNSTADTPLTIEQLNKKAKTPDPELFPLARPMIEVISDAGMIQKLDSVPEFFTQPSQQDRFTKLLLAVAVATLISEFDKGERDKSGLANLLKLVDTLIDLGKMAQQENETSTENQGPPPEYDEAAIEAERQQRAREEEEGRKRNAEYGYDPDEVDREMMGVDKMSLEGGDELEGESEVGAKQAEAEFDANGQQVGAGIDAVLNNDGIQTEVERKDQEVEAEDQYITVEAAENKSSTADKTGQSKEGGWTQRVAPEGRSDNRGSWADKVTTGGNSKESEGQTH